MVQIADSGVGWKGMKRELSFFHLGTVEEVMGVKVVAR